MWADPRFKKAPAVRRCIAHGARRVGVSPDSPERRKRDVSKRIGTAFRLGAAAQRLRIDPGDYQKPAAESIRDKLTVEQYRVTQESGTERAFTGEFWDKFEKGIYVDVVTGEPLFSSTDSASAKDM